MFEMMNICIKYGTEHIDWMALCEIFRLAPLGARDPEKLKIASENSHTVCSAYAGGMIKGKKQVDACPGLGPDILERFSESEAAGALDTDPEKAIAELKGLISKTDLGSAALRLNEPFYQDKLTIKILGKNVSVDQHGNLVCDIHMNAWVAIPLFNYILNGKGLAPVGEWVPLRELKGGADWYRL
jgi:hypothetical protein